jgi:peptidoglycan/LPS O-acetylase OafA/YrhL
VVYHWPWYWHLPSLGPWLLLALAVALPRANRHRHALLIFIPMLIVALLWPRAAQRAGISSADATQFGFLIDFLVVGLALLWLNAETLGRVRALNRFAGSLGLLLLAGLAVVLSYWGAFPRRTGILLTVTGVAALILLVSLLLTRRLAHRRYQPLRFMLWLAAWSLVCSLIGAAALTGAMMLVSPYPIQSWRTVLIQMVMPGLIIGLCLYAVSLPYLLLMFSSPFFRRRFQVWLGVESLPPQAQAANSEGLYSGRNE